MIVAVAAMLLAGGAQASEVEMLDCSGMPCVTVQAAGGTSLKLLIDTGNSNSVLDLSQAKSLGLAIDPVPVTDSSGKPIPGYFVSTLKDVRIGQDTLGDVKFLTVDISKEMDKGTIPRANGTIAYTAFKGRLLTLDYRRHIVGISAASPDAPCATACGRITNPTFGRRGPPIVVTTGFRVNGKDVSVQVDTLYSGTMLIYPTAVSRLRLKAEAASPRIDYFPFTDGGVDMVRGNAAEESFGDRLLLANAPLYFATPKVHTPDGMFDGTVGAALFAGHVVNLDFRRNRFWME